MTVLLELPGGYHAPLSAHAIDRWRELVCPLRTERHAISLLEQLALDVGKLVTDPPAWVVPYRVEQLAAAYLLVGDYALPLVHSDTFDGLVFVTTLARGNVPPFEREQRSGEHRDRRRRAARRRHKSADRRTGASAAARAKRAPDVDQWP